MDESYEMNENDRKDIETELSGWRQKWDSLSGRERTEIILKVVAVIFCTSALLFYSYLLFEQYLSGRTVVSVRVERLRHHSIPALTICYPRALSMKGMADRYPELRADFELYKKVMYGVTDDDYSNERIRNYLHNTYEVFENYFQSKNLTLYELFDGDITLPFRTAHNESRFQTAGPLITVTVDDVNGNADTGYVLVDNNPVQSLIPYSRHNMLKCFTFFSELDHKWRNQLINFQTMNIQIRHNELHYPPTLWDDKAFPGVLYEFHSSNGLPFGGLSQSMKILTSDGRYLMNFRTTETHSLPPNYVTNCRVYDPDGSDGERTRADCKLRCYLSGVGAKCKASNRGTTVCDNCFMVHNVFVRKYLNERTIHYRLCDESVSNTEFKPQSAKLEALCDEKCQNDCHFRYYFVEESQRIEGTYRLDEKMHDKSVWDKYIEVRLKHVNGPDGVVAHVAEMSPVAFVSNLGGLLGLWLGLSAYVILKLCLKCLFRILS